ncbi:MAG: recombination-associated protein RdgC [Rhodocyclaceae bacterium]
MWFKNLIVYRIPANWECDLTEMDDLLSRHALQRCGSFEMESRGWVAPCSDGRFVHSVHRQLLVALGVERKLLPASVVNQFTKERAAEVAEQQGYPVGRKQLREIKENVIEQLLPKAFALRRTTRAWVDPVNGWLVIDAGAKGKAEEFTEMFRRSIEDAPFWRLDTQRSPAAAMTEWVASGDGPAGFSIDQDLDLCSVGEGKATVRYVRHGLEGKEIQDHVAAGKTATRLGMTWSDRISFVLDEALQIRRLSFLDVLKDGAEGQGENADEQFDIEFVLMAGELSRLLADLVAALGGEKERPT